MSNKQNAACGLDFGTTNTAISVVKNGLTSVVHLEGNHATLPSALFYNQPQRTVMFGREAVTSYLDGTPGRLMRALKSVLGSSLMQEDTPFGPKRVPFKDIIGLFITHVKMRAEELTQQNYDHVVVGRPVFFVDDDREADQQAENELRSIIQAVGFKHISFEYEPLAAARDYETQITQEEQVLVVDIGGGTSDFSVIRLSPDARMKEDRSNDILGNSGIHLAGTDFDRLFSLASVMPEMGYRTTMKNRPLEMPSGLFITLATWHLINSLYTDQTMNEIRQILNDASRPDLFERYVTTIDHQRGHEVAHIVEQAKISLSRSEQTVMDFSFIEKGWHVPITAKKLEFAIGGIIQKIMSVALETVIEKAGTSPGKISTVFMTGGSTLLPGFETVARRLMPEAKIIFGDHFSSVASGLGIAAARRYG